MTGARSRAGGRMCEETGRRGRRFALDVGGAAVKWWLRWCIENGSCGGFVVGKGDFGGEWREGEVMEVGGGAVLATRAFSVGIVGEVHRQCLSGVRGEKGEVASSFVMMAEDVE